MTVDNVAMTRRGQHSLPSRHRQVRGILIWQIAALAGQVLAVALARHGIRPVAEVVSDISLAAAYGRALWALIVPDLDRFTRNTAVVCLGVTPTLMWRATNPLLFTGFDEQLHMRTLGDILSSHRLFEANPLLEVSPRYPGLEATATLVHQLGIPTMAATFIVIIASRVVLVTVLADAVEHMTGSLRASGLAVAVYALSSQYVFFNSQFAYQTMAMPLALAAVSFLARARNSDHPIPLVIGSTVCLVAVSVTHHITSFLTAGLLLMWTLAERGRRRVWVAYGACAAMASTLSWALLQRQLLSNYFTPIADDLRSQLLGGARRALFKDSAGTVARTLDQYLLLYYAVALSVIVLTVLVLAYKEHHLRSGPTLMLAAMSASVPLLLAARVVPKGGEIYDRSNSFLFLPFALYVASFAAWFLWREPHQPGFRRDRRSMTVRLAAVALASAAFLGGYILGGGPNWARLPGPYMAAADTRSMDAETLAAVKWSGENLAAGSRIAADRVSSVLLAAQAGLWPVMKGPNGIDVAALYVADSWGLPETDKAVAMRLRYLYVDRRLAAEKPHYGSYFFQGETGEGKQFTAQQLSKFDSVPGISVVYRHGPVSIYDLKGLGFAELRSGWFGTTPQVRVATELAVGTLCGLLIALLLRSRIGPLIRAEASALWRSAGPALTGATALAAVCLVSINMVITHVWLTPITIGIAVLVVMLADPPASLRLLRRAAGAVSGHRLRTAVLVIVPLAVVTAAAIADAATVDVVEVRQILDDPAAVHVSPNGPLR